MINWFKKKVEYYYIFASTKNINNMKDLVKEEKQTYIWFCIWDLDWKDDYIQVWLDQLLF